MAAGPTSDTALQRQDLGEAAYEAMIAESDFIALDVMPQKFVSVQSGEFPVIPREALFNVPDDGRDDRGHYNRDNWEFESGFYKTVDRGIEAVKDDRELAMYSSLFDYEAVLANRALFQALRAHEVRVAAAVFNATNFTAHSVTNEWDDAANATPKADVAVGRKSMAAAGVRANTLIIAESTLFDLQACSDVQTAVYQMFPDAAKSGTVEISHLLAYFEIEKILVGRALKNTAKKGQAASLSQVWSSEYAMLCRTSTSDDITDPAIGRTFIWNEGQNQRLIVEDYRDNPARADIIRTRWDVDPRLLASFDSSGTVKSKIYDAAAYLFDNITT